MNAGSKKVFSIALLCTGVFALLCTGFYTYGLISHYLPSVGQFETGVFSDVFLPLLYILAIVAFAVFGFLFRTSLSGRTYKNVLSVLFASGFGALVTVIWLFTFALDFFGSSLSTPATLFGVLLIVFGLAAVAYFILCATPTPSHTYTVILGMGTALFMLVYAFYAYFDTAFALNSPIKILDQVTAIALMLFFLAETRFRFGAISEAVFFPIGMTATVLAASNGIGALIYNAVLGRPLVTHVMHDFLFLALALYALSRLISFLLPPLFREEEDASPESPTFETENAIGHAPLDPDAPAQETFDFDKEPEEESGQAAPLEAMRAETSTDTDENSNTNPEM